MIERVGALYKLLEAHFPDHRSKQGHLDIARLARDLGYSHETLYRAIRGNTMKPPVALRLLQFSAQLDEPLSPRLFWEDLAPFVLPKFHDYSRPASNDPGVGDLV